MFAFFKCCAPQPPGRAAKRGVSSAKRAPRGEGASQRGDSAAGSRKRLSKRKSAHVRIRAPADKEAKSTLQCAADSADARTRPAVSLDDVSSSLSSDLSEHARALFNAESANLMPADSTPRRLPAAPSTPRGAPPASAARLPQRHRRRKVSPPPPALHRNENPFAPREPGGQLSKVQSILRDATKPPSANSGSARASVSMHDILSVSANAAAEAPSSTSNWVNSKRANVIGAGPTRRPSGRFQEEEEAFVGVDAVACRRINEARANATYKDERIRQSLRGDAALRRSTVGNLSTEVSIDVARRPMELFLVKCAFCERKRQHVADPVNNPLPERPVQPNMQQITSGVLSVDDDGSDSEMSDSVRLVVDGGVDVNDPKTWIVDRGEMAFFSSVHTAALKGKLMAQEARAWLMAQT